MVYAFIFWYPFLLFSNNVVYEKLLSDNNMDSLIGFHNSKPTENYTASIFNVICTIFPCVQLYTVIPMYGLNLIAAPSTVIYSGLL